MWAVPHFWQTPPAATAPPLSVAILPFTAPTGSAAEEQVADELTRDLTLAIGRNRLVKVVSQSAAATYKDKPINARAVGRHLNVRYIVEGDVRRAGERIMVDAQLVDTGNAAQAWNGRLELEEARTAQNRNGLLARLANRLGNALIDTEVARADKPPASDASAIEFVLYGQHLFRTDLASPLRGALRHQSSTTRRYASTPALGRRWSTRRAPWCGKCISIHTMITTAWCRRRTSLPCAP